MPKSGSVVAVDASGRAISERRFVDAQVRETVLPALDVTSTDTAYLTLKLAPASVQASRSAGTAPARSGRREAPPLASTFRLEIDGVDATSVRRIESFTVAQQAAGSAGLAKERITLRAVSGSGGVVFPNLEVTLPEAAAQTWTAWAQEFLVRGRNDDSAEKTGRLILLSADARTGVLRIEFQGVGIAALRPVEGGMVRALLYVEDMKLR